MDLSKERAIKDKSTGKIRFVKLYKISEFGERYTCAEGFESCERTIGALLESLQKEWAEIAQHEQEEKFYDEKVKRGLTPAPEELKIYEWA